MMNTYSLVELQHEASVIAGTMEIDWESLEPFLHDIDTAINTSNAYIADLEVLYTKLCGPALHIRHPETNSVLSPDERMLYADAVSEELVTTYVQLHLYSIAQLVHSLTGTLPS
jgi:hypothetical protein